MLAAVLIDAPAQDGCRAAMRSLLLARQQRLHWHDEAPARRMQLATAVGDLGLSAVVVVRIPVDQRRQDRARRMCLKRLLWELQGSGVVRIRAESRQLERDRADTRALATFRRSGILAAHMMFEHARPLREECLWYADIVAGAVLAGLRGDSRYRKPLDGSLREVRLELRYRRTREPGARRPAGGPGSASGSLGSDRISLFSRVARGKGPADAAVPVIVSWCAA